MSRFGVWTATGFLLLAACMDYKFNLGSDVEGADTAAPAPPDDEATEPDAPGDTEAPADSGEPGDSDPPSGDLEPDTDPAAGCADGEREGFLDWEVWPDIAACSGAWSVPGITRDDLAATCGYGGGDDGPTPEGDGCSAMDLCQEGWHICDGADEVEDLAGSCDGAVPEGTPDKALFFAVVQHSVDGTVCDDSTDLGNDVFGCGNLGHTLSEDKDCGVLNRALASTQPGTCGYNEAEPGYGPWECRGDDDSHLAEGTLVTKAGCPGDSCSYDGAPVGSSDKGGVICCRD